MATRVGINGFGRIGRQALRAIMERHADTLEVVVVNDRTDFETNAHLFKYDSTYGIYPSDVQALDGSIVIGDMSIQALSEADPADLRWGDAGVDIVIECTGVFTDADNSAKHLASGAKKVIISAPANNDDITLVLGVNERRYDPDKHNIVSNASCPTHCIA
ncbi:MAG: type I glyceraldehyde-3-phosphate dehydrogenase, partial [Chloroflexi bacterium]|nr:type I glyceraldehyde-3-phosphate dehydrogenase [Chloroflexota bacterium]